MKKTTGKPNHVHPFLRSSSYSPNFRVILFYFTLPRFALCFGDSVQRVSKRLIS
ncbi:hypothetical protein HanPSC8_Chr17g0789181 [Helianthus annuus]|nr:hypothetical protein HanPSC8_Chr17g0789181 [Helianthus annuus]